MKVSDAGKQFILDWETGGGVPGKGVMKLQPWPDPPGSGRYSIGAGYNFDPNVEPELSEGITEQKAWELFYSRANTKQKSLNTIFKTVALNQRQFDALFSFAWNLGASPNTTLFRYIKEGKPESEIRAKWEEYHNYRDHGVMVASEYLRQRRIAEADLFFSKPGELDIQLAGYDFNMPDWTIWAIAALVLVVIIFLIFKKK
jgi:GH24 family phage-related lysozyme (muramidase)